MQRLQYSQASEAFIVAQHQPLLVLDYCRRRELEMHSILKGSGLQDCHLPPTDYLISAEQYLHLLQNLAEKFKASDTSFLLGQQMLPGHYGCFSQAFMHAPNLRHALDLLVQMQTKLCPLLSPRWRIEGNYAVLYWLDSFGAKNMRGFLVEMHMTALVAMCRWLSGQRMPWRFCFNRTRPRYYEQHEVHLGNMLRFDCQFDAMLIETSWLDQTWPRGNAMAVALAEQQCAQELAAQPVRQGILAALYDYLLHRIRSAPTLEQTAHDFQISTASLKRHLARHGSHFQAELDQVRTHVAMRLFHTEGWDNEAVANYLGFHDANNFRRSFKRWTGLTPMLIRQGLINALA